MPADDIVVVTAAGVLTSLRTGLLDQARRDSLNGETVETIAGHLVESTNRAFDLLAGGMAALGAHPARERSRTASQRSVAGRAKRSHYGRR